MEQHEFLMLGGHVMPVEEDLLDPIMPMQSHYIKPARSQKYEAEVKVYLHGRDEVWTYNLKGITGQIQISTPTAEDRSFVSVNTAAKLLLDAGIDLPMFQTLIKWALNTEMTVHSTRPEEVALYEALVKMDNTLGGTDGTT